MASNNEYYGYVKLPGKEAAAEKVRLDFNGHVDAQSKGTKLGGFALRIFVSKKGPKDDQPEISVTLRPEEWLDLIDAMKEEFEDAQTVRKQFDDLQKGEEGQ
jgi:hypothetical protein